MAQLRLKSIVRLTPAADYSTYEGYGVTIANGVATLSASATVPIDGIIVEGGTVAQGVVVALVSADGGFAAKLSGAAVAQGTKLMQAADGTFTTDVGSGTARVQIAIANEAGVAGDLIEVHLRGPAILA